MSSLLPSLEVVHAIDIVTIFHEDEHLDVALPGGRSKAVSTAHRSHTGDRSPDDIQGPRARGRIFPFVWQSVLAHRLVPGLGDMFVPNL